MNEYGFFYWTLMLLMIHYKITSVISTSWFWLAFWFALPAIALVVIAALLKKQIEKLILKAEADKALKGVLKNGKM